MADKVGLNEDQKKKLQELADDVQQKRMDLFSSGPPADQQEMQDRMQTVQKITADQKEKALAVLTADWIPSDRYPSLTRSRSPSPV